MQLIVILLKENASWAVFGTSVIITMETSVDVLSKSSSLKAQADDSLLDMRTCPMCPGIELTSIIHMSLAPQSVSIHNVKVIYCKLRETEV